MLCCEGHLEDLAQVELSSLTPQLDPWPLPGMDDAEPGVDEREVLNERLARLTELNEHAAYHVSKAAQVADASRSFAVDGARSVASWLVSTSHLAKADAHRAVRRGRVLADHRLLDAAWKSHHITGAHVDRFARLVSDNPDVIELLIRDEELLVGAASTLSPEDYGRLCDRWRDLADPDAAYERWRRSHERRYLSTAHDLEGNLVFEGRIDGVEGEAFYRAIAKRENELFLADWAAAKRELGRNPKVSELGRTSAQRRLDALAALVRQGAGASAAHPDSAASASPATDLEPTSEVMIHLVVDPFTMRDGLDRVFGAPGCGGGGACASSSCGCWSGDDRPMPPTTVWQTNGAKTAAAFDPYRRCETIDGLPVPPEVAVRLAFEARIRRVVCDAPSVIVDAGRTRRLFTGAQRDLIKLRDRTCRHPMCRQPFWVCEIDHVIPAGRDGPTDLANGALLCPTHHDDKSKGRVVVRHGPRGRLVWFRPDGTQFGTT